jgi:hypothetical protein
MHPAVLVEILKITGACLGLASAVFITLWQIRQKTMTKELKLADNPERCGQHEEAITTLKLRLEKLDEGNDKDHGEMFRQLGAMCVEIAKLGRNGGVGK